MAGYDRYSMSNNARAAYADGEKPISKWTKTEILDAMPKEKAKILSKLTVAELRAEVLRHSSWHHTSSKYNRTDFYAINEDAVDRITEKRVASIVASRIPKKKEKTALPKEQRVKVRYTIWEKKSRFGRPKPREIVEIVTVPANGGLVKTSYGNKRQASLQFLETIK